MRFSSVPFLLVAIIVATILATRRLVKQGRLPTGDASSIYRLLAIFVAWGVTSTTLSIAKVYTSSGFLSLLPGLWLPCIPVSLAIVAVSISPQLRSALRSLTDHTPWRWMIGLQGLRVFAIGVIFKAAIGDFLHNFAFWSGIPDFIFGLSALFLSQKRSLSRRTYLIWNIVGVALIVPASLLLWQMGLPGPMQIFLGEPSGLRLFDFPIVLAPTLVVPLFVLLNVLAVAGCVNDTREIR